jgi:hypothetical protein
MCVQLDFEVICKRPKKEGRLPNLHEFWNDEVHYKKNSKKEIFDV